MIVLPTGAGKAAIAELARRPRTGTGAGACVKGAGRAEPRQIRASWKRYFAAGLKRKESQAVVFGSVQSVARNLDAFL